MTLVPWQEGDVIHKLRRIAGWTVQQLAKKAKVNPSVIYRLEDGRTKEPKRQTLIKLAGAFGLSARELMEAIPSGSLQLQRVEHSAAPTHEQARRRA